jgi:hypothetical protein
MWLVGRDPTAADVGGSRATATRRRLLLDLIAVIGQYIPEPRPALLRDRDSRTKVRLHLRDTHIDTAIVLAYVEIEILVVDVHVSALGQVRFVRVLVGAELVEEVGEGVAELDHSLRRDGHLRTGTPSGYRLGDAEETTPRVLLQVEVIASVVLDHHLAFKFAVFGDVVWIRRSWNGNEPLSVKKRTRGRCVAASRAYPMRNRSH